MNVCLADAEKKLFLSQTPQPIPQSNFINFSLPSENGECQDNEIIKLGCLFIFFERVIPVASFIRLAARVEVAVAEEGKLARYKTALEQIALGKMASISW